MQNRITKSSLLALKLTPVIFFQAVKCKLRTFSVCIRLQKA